MANDWPLPGPEGTTVRVPGRRALEYVSQLGQRPGGHAYRAEVAHDDGCPSLKRNSWLSCTCEIVWITVRQL